MSPEPICQPSFWELGSPSDAGSSARSRSPGGGSRRCGGATRQVQRFQRVQDRGASFMFQLVTPRIGQVRPRSRRRRCTPWRGRRGVRPRGRSRGCATARGKWTSMNSSNPLPPSVSATHCSTRSRPTCTPLAAASARRVRPGPSARLGAPLGRVWLWERLGGLEAGVEVSCHPDQTAVGLGPLEALHRTPVPSMLM